MSLEIFITLFSPPLDFHRYFIFSEFSFGSRKTKALLLRRCANRFQLFVDFQSIHHHARLPYISINRPRILADYHCRDQPLEHTLVATSQTHESSLYSFISQKRTVRILFHDTTSLRAAIGCNSKYGKKREKLREIFFLRLEGIIKSGLSIKVRF